MLRGEKAEIDYKEINGKYPFFDDGTGLKWVTCSDVTPFT